MEEIKKYKILDLLNFEVWGYNDDFWVEDRMNKLQMRDSYRYIVFRWSYTGYYYYLIKEVAR